MDQDQTPRVAINIYEIDIDSFSPSFLKEKGIVGQAPKTPRKAVEKEKPITLVVRVGFAQEITFSDEVASMDEGSKTSAPNTLLLTKNMLFMFNEKKVNQIPEREAIWQNCGATARSLMHFAFMKGYAAAKEQAEHAADSFSVGYI